MLNTFQLVTLDFWEDIYNKVIHKTSSRMYTIRTDSIEVIINLTNSSND